MRNLPGIPVLYGDGFLLRPFRSDDAASLARQIRNSGIASRVTNVPVDYTRADAMRWIAQCIAMDDAVRSGVALRIDWVIAQANRGSTFTLDDVNGSISFINIAPHKAQLSYWLSYEYRGRGIMAMAARLVTQFGFDECGFSRLWAATRDDNIASQNVLRRAGYTEEGIHHNEWWKDGRAHDSRVYAVWTEERRAA